MIFIESLDAFIHVSQSIPTLTKSFSRCVKSAGYGIHNLNDPNINKNLYPIINVDFNIQKASLSSQNNLKQIHGFLTNVFLIVSQNLTSKLHLK